MLNKRYKWIEQKVEESRKNLKGKLKKRYM